MTITFTVITVVMSLVLMWWIARLTRDVFNDRNPDLQRRLHSTRTTILLVGIWQALIGVTLGVDTGRWMSGFAPFLLGVFMMLIVFVGQRVGAFTAPPPKPWQPSWMIKENDVDV